MKSLYCQVGWNQTAGEEHRDQVKCCEKSSSIKMLSGKRVGSRNIDNECHKRSHNYVSNRIPVASPQLCVARQLLIPFEVNSFWKEHNLSVGYGCRITERCNDDEVHRIQGNDDQKHADRIQDDIENPVFSGFLYFVC